MKDDRELIKLARAMQNAEQIAHQLNTSLPSILKVAKRLGVNLGPQIPRPGGRFKAKKSTPSQRGETIDDT
jgi:hypothetical protein